MKKRCSERITGCISRRSKSYWDYSKRTFSQNFSKVVEAAFATHRDPCKECLDFLTYSYWWMVASLTLCTTLSLTFLDSSDVQVPNIQIYRYLRPCGCEIKKHLLLGRKAMTNLDSILKSRDITLPTKVCLVKAMYPVVMFGCESWTIKKTEWRRIDAFELWCWRRLKSPLDCKGIQSVHPKGDQSWIFIGRTDAEAETPILWLPDAKNWLIGKDPDAGKDWRLEEKGTTEDEMVGWHHRLNGHEFWVNSGSWWWTGRPGVLQSMGLQRVGHDWATELTELTEGTASCSQTKESFISSEFPHHYTCPFLRSVSVTLSIPPASLHSHT